MLVWEIETRDRKRVKPTERIRVDTTVRVSTLQRERVTLTTLVFTIVLRTLASIRTKASCTYVPTLYQYLSVSVLSTSSLSTQKRARR